MRTFLRLCTLLLTPATLFAQAVPVPSSGAAAASQSVNMVVLGSGDCPIGVNATRNPGGGLVQTKPSAPVRGQALQLSFTPIQHEGIVQVELDVHGMTGAHVIPAGQHSVAEATEAFTVSPAAGEDHHFTSVIYMRKLTGIDFVEIHDVTYGNGTHWHSSPTSTCRVAPNGFRLVASGR